MVTNGKDVANNFLNAVLNVLQHYKVVLYAKRNQKQYIDDYGVIVDNGWKKEKEYFVMNVLLEDKQVANCIKEMKKAEIFVLNHEESRWVDNIYIKNDHVITNYVSLIKAKELVKDVCFAFQDVPYDEETEDPWWFRDKIQQAKQKCCDRGIEPPIFDCLIDAFLETLNLKTSETGANSPLEYEQKIANKLQELGFIVRVTKASGDQGADIIAEKDGKSFAIQCKLYSSPVGNKAVQEAYAAATFYQKDKGVVVSNADFTKSARQLANTCEIILLNDYQLDHLLDYV